MPEAAIITKPGRPADPASPERLRSFFSARRIALVGATDESGWTRNILASMSAARSSEGRVFPVHPRRETVQGLKAFRRIEDIDGGVDLAFSLVRPDLVETVLGDAASSGVRNVIVIASGFGEAGDAGRAMEHSLAAKANALGITMLGPNSIGFFNSHAGTAPCGAVVRDDLIAGPVGLASHSGALAGSILRFANARGIGLSHFISMGNQAQLVDADIIDYLVEDDATRVIALFMESIKEPDRFVRSAQAALRAGKPVVVLKTGRTQEGQRAAMAHTGAVAGDDAVADAVLRDLGVVRVDSLEELLGTAGLFGYAKRLPKGRRVGIVTGSGGACDILADIAPARRLSIADFSAATTQAIEAILPAFAKVHNPLDVTGFEQSRGRKADGPTALELAVEAVSNDPGIDFIFGMVRPIPKAALKPGEPNPLASLGEIVARSPIPVFLTDATCIDVTANQRALLEDAGLSLLPGLHLGIAAAAHAADWAERRAAILSLDALAAESTRPLSPEPPAEPRSWSEHASREHVAGFGVPLVPARLARSVEEAVEAAESLGMPVALKVCSAQIPHKSDVGGVVLNCRNADEVRAAFASIEAAVGRKAPDASVDGVLVSPMRSGGTELFAGIAVDQTFGPFVTVGLGGVWIEILRDVAIAKLPVTQAKVADMLRSLRAAALLTGGRGRRPVDIDAAAQAIKSLCDAAWSLGERLESVEVNPFLASADGVEALDALIVTRG